MAREGELILIFKKVDRYLLSSFLITLLVVVVALSVTIIVINMVEQLRDFIDHAVPLMQVLEYYAYFGGWVIKSFLPMFILLAVLFSVSILARKNEFLAMRASGLSLYRITLPYFLIVTLIAAGHFYYNEYIYPPWNQKRLEIKEFTIEKRSRKSYEVVNNVFRQIKPGYFYTVGVLDVDRREGKDLKIYKTGQGKLQQLTTAPLMNFEDFRWVARNGVVRYFDDSSQESFTEFDTLSLPDLVDKPEELARPLGKPEDMGYDQLKHYIQLMKRIGVPYVRESIDLGIKVSFPVTSIIVVLIAIPFAANPKRGSVATSFAVGASISLSYFVLFRVLQSAGDNERIPQLMAIWGVNGLFLLAAVVIYWRAQK